MIVNLGLIILFAIALHFEKKNLNVFGILPVPKRILQLLLGISLTAVLSITINIMFGGFANFTWTLNSDYSIQHILDNAYRTLNSVLFEELIFRTYLLYKLFQYIGEKKSIIITSAIFGIYHWFTFGILGNYTMMIWILFYTGLWGAMFAISYTRTGTIFLTIGLHWGWNFFDQAIFNRNGKGLLLPVTSDKTIFLNNVSSFLITVLPTILFAVIIIVYLAKAKVVQINKT
jgi:membrane protease YdiL (CAAX protease family)